MNNLKDIESHIVDIFKGSTEILLFAIDSDKSEKFDRRTDQALFYLASTACQMLKGVLELRATLEDLIMARRMLKRYPWHGTEISKVKHIELTWFLFQNLCYKFKEKLKLCFNAQKRLSSFLKIEPPTWLKAELKVADIALGSTIRARGNTVHNWDVKHSSIDWLNTVTNFEFAKAQGEDVALSEMLLDVDGHYRSAKLDLRNETEEMERAAIAITLRILTFHAPTPKNLFSQSQALFDLAKSGQKLTLIS